MSDPMMTVSHCTSNESTGASGATATLIHSDLVRSPFGLPCPGSKRLGFGVVPHRGARVVATFGGNATNAPPQFYIIPASHGVSCQTPPLDGQPPLQPGTS
jgi:hypothetical protein